MDGGDEGDGSWGVCLELVAGDLSVADIPPRVGTAPFVLADISPASGGNHEGCPYARLPL